MDLATAIIIGEANIDPEYINLVESIRNMKGPRDIPLSSSMKDFPLSGKTYQYRRQNVEMLFCPNYPQKQKDRAVRPIT